MNEGTQWVTLLVAIIAAVLISAAVGMWTLCLVEWARAKLHRRKMRRQRLRW